MPKGLYKELRHFSGSLGYQVNTSDSRDNSMSNESNETPIAADAIVGQTIANYKIVQRIANTLVFLAYKNDPDNQVAIKFFYPDPIADNKDLILERLEGVCQLDHPNIIKAYEVGVEKGIIYVVMEYSPGENLYDLLQRNPRLHWAAAAEIAREITRGLVSAHAMGVNHLSLHPDRILLSTSGQIRVNFCNEGVITPSSEVVNYVSPELFFGQELEERSDVYSLGAIIYSIVIGTPPLKGKSPKEIALKHRQFASMLPSYGVADIPHSLSLIIERTMSKELKQRYSNSYELLAALNNFLLNDIGGKHVFLRNTLRKKNNLRLQCTAYLLGSYKELLPKIVVSSESDKSFSEAINQERDRLKQQDPPSSIEEKPVKVEEKSSRKSTSGEFPGQTSKIYKESLKSRFSHSVEAKFGRHYVLVIFTSIFSFVTSLVLFFTV